MPWDHWQQHDKWPVWIYDTGEAEDIEAGDEFGDAGEVWGDADDTWGGGE